jgi:thiamine biosynthesis lipoprotein
MKTVKSDQVSRTWLMMGTFVTVRMDGSDKVASEDILRRVFEEMRRIESLLNHFDPTSEVGRLNTGGELNDASPELLAVLRTAEAVSALSGGAFDVSVMPLMHLYGEHSRDGGWPTSDEIGRAMQSVGYGDIAVRGRSVHFRKAGMRVSLAGVAKGYIVDRAIAVLTECGVTRAMVDGGGDIRVIAGPDEPPWRVGIRDPRSKQEQSTRDDPKKLLCTVEVRNAAVASSGAYAHDFNDIIDPRTGLPAEAVSGASVICGETALADALATCMLVLGPDDGISLIEQNRTSGAEAIITPAYGEPRRSQGWPDAPARA